MTATSGYRAKKLYTRFFYSVYPLKLENVRDRCRVYNTHLVGARTFTRDDRTSHDYRHAAESFYRL